MIKAETKKQLDSAHEARALAEHAAHGANERLERAREAHILALKHARFEEWCEKHLRAIYEAGDKAQALLAARLTLDEIGQCRLVMEGQRLAEAKSKADAHTKHVAAHVEMRANAAAVGDVG